MPPINTNPASQCNIKSNPKKMKNAFFFTVLSEAKKDIALHFFEIEVHSFTAAFQHREMFPPVRAH